MLTVRRAPRRHVALLATLGSLESVTALVLAHLAAGGAVPSVWWLAVFAALVYAAGGLVLRGRASIRLVLPGLVAAQLLGHAWLVALAPEAHGHGHPMSALLGLTPAMLVAHLVAAAVTGTMWMLRRRAVEVLLRWTDPGVVPVPVLRRIRAATPRRLRTAQHARALAPTRGPPRLRATTA
ncbi:hypothetical protein KVF89_09065 [Nocardioides carbamazepini]|uniref:hypothetical protein n=1 Tax=Nocardioides carbamazepini TaxID=2854259 RepID=UPI00214A7CC9|nr:hypothetical protein [Nocardioides carbamazepini]MCR1782680.1 hypothetical protein [Nocardioides carbamazepini]